MATARALNNKSPRSGNCGVSIYYVCPLIVPFIGTMFGTMIAKMFAHVFANMFIIGNEINDIHIYIYA